tara:strand:+ start:280 stop:741 length:462 start_codon:yes stop_codon:yes gene_type:complete
MLFKRLTQDELNKLEKEFVEFLVLNGITAEDWEKLKEENPQNASQMIDSFSDVIYASTMRQVKYLERITKNEILCFYCQPEQIVLVGLESNNSSVDFTQLEDLSNVAEISQDVHIYTSTKSYSKVREQEIFDLIQNGASISDNNLFNALCLGL